LGKSFSRIAIDALLINSWSHAVGTVVTAVAATFLTGGIAAYIGGAAALATWAGGSTVATELADLGLREAFVNTASTRKKLLAEVQEKSTKTCWRLNEFVKEPSVRSHLPDGWIDKCTSADDAKGYLQSVDRLHTIEDSLWLDADAVRHFAVVGGFQPKEGVDDQLEWTGFGLANHKEEGKFQETAEGLQNPSLEESRKQACKLPTSKAVKPPQCTKDLMENPQKSTLCLVPNDEGNDQGCIQSALRLMFNEPFQEVKDDEGQTVLYQSSKHKVAVKIGPLTSDKVEVYSLRTEQWALKAQLIAGFPWICEQQAYKASHGGGDPPRVYGVGQCLIENSDTSKSPRLGVLIMEALPEKAE